jgi:hypothetical protein
VRREELEHIIRAAADVCEESEIVVIGSQAILALHPDAPAEMVFSLEADLYPRHAPKKAIEIEGSIGDGSPFQRQFGYYAHAAGPETAKAPRGWMKRLIAVEVLARIGSDQRFLAHCMEPNDLVLAKCVAGRERDWGFARHAISAGLVDPVTLSNRLADLPIGEDHRRHIEEMLEGLITSIGRG